MDYIRAIFARMFLVTRKWEVIFNRESSELTLKQLMCLIVIKNAFESDPTIKEIAGALSTSHQNVKAIVLQLERKGHVNLYKDKVDKRVTRVEISNQKLDFWKEQDIKDTKSLMSLFDGIDEEALKTTLETILKLEENADNQL